MHDRCPDLGCIHAQRLARIFTPTTLLHRADRYPNNADLYRAAFCEHLIIREEEPGSGLVQG